MPLRLDNAKSVAHMPTAEQQQTKKDFKPRFKVDPAASPMPEIRLPERLATGRHQNRNAGRDHLGMLGEIKSEYPGEIVGIGSRTKEALIRCCDEHAGQIDPAARLTLVALPERIESNISPIEVTS